MSKVRSTALEAVMQGAESQFTARAPRPHLVHEYVDRGMEQDAESLCYKLTPRARMLARGECRPHVKKRIERYKERLRLELLNTAARTDVRAAWDAYEAGAT